MRSLCLALSLLPGLAMASPLRVVATIPDLAALAREVGQDHASVRSLALPTQDPHFVDARPHLALELNKADLLVLAGLDLEIGWLPVLITGSRNPRIQPGSEGYFDASAYAVLKEVPRVKIDRAMGDVHPGGNPHYLVDPRNAIRVAHALAERMAKLDPEHGDIFEHNAAAFEKAARARMAEWEKLLAPYRGAKVVTYHKSWIYLLDWLGLKELDTIEPKPGIPPNPQHVARLLIKMKREKPAMILQEAYYPANTARLLSSKTGVPVLILPGGTDVDSGERYLDHIDRFVRSIAEVLAKADASRTAEAAP
ncbi:MAG: zinc ABC transporter substrate-binding protein [Deltaproteobacteria bacterium]|nr:MAG: zinc ABC transporter substrate-binding protein [Deltaproteobacteria bacterium]